MSTLIRIAAATAWLIVGGAIAATAGQATPPPAAPANDDCLGCHSDPAAARANGTLVAVDPPVFAASKHGPLACVDCHADLAKLTEFPHADRLEKVNCASCHDEIGATYHDSIHARARERSGLNVAPTCANCHGKHDILGKADPKSRVAHGQVPATCGTCHDGIKQRFDQSVHATALGRNLPDAPVCSSCHTAHNIQRADNDGSRVRAAEGCGTCHANVAAAFVRTFHGKVSQLGSGRAATCANCHNAHDILPASNAFSTIAPQNLQRTCSSCHEGASARFVQYDPHPNPDDYERSAVLWWANKFYWILIPGCFGFFGLHSLLWFWRARKDARAHQEQGQ
jgi:hypothetical protein